MGAFLRVDLVGWTDMTSGFLWFSFKNDRQRRLGPSAIGATWRVDEFAASFNIT